MRETARLVFVIYIVFSVWYAFGQEKKDSAPKLTDVQKLEIREAQVSLYQAKEVLESTPQFKAFQEAQNHLNETALRIQRESKVDPKQWTLGQDLEYVAVKPDKK